MLVIPAREVKVKRLEQVACSTDVFELQPMVLFISKFAKLGKFGARSELKTD